MCAGENAFGYVFTQESATASYGPLTRLQKIRAVTVCVAWCFGALFVSVQAYLAFRVNKSYLVALVSYAGEVFGLSLAFLMPALAGIDHLLWLCPYDDGFDEALDVGRAIVHCFIRSYKGSSASLYECSTTHSHAAW